MCKIVSNGSNKNDKVKTPFRQMLAESKRAFLAAPYFTDETLLIEAAEKGIEIQLLIGLKCPNKLDAIQKVHEATGIEVKYCNDFHAKIYIFDKAALLGSANLTDSGLSTKREAVIKLDRKVDSAAYHEMRTLFNDLWKGGFELRQEDFDAFMAKFDEQSEQCNRWSTSKKEMETALKNARKGSRKPRVDPLIQREANLQRTYDEYLSAFNEVKGILAAPEYRRKELEEFGPVHETDRFLNYIKEIRKRRKKSLKAAPGPLPKDERREFIIFYADMWRDANDIKVPDIYPGWLKTVEQTFQTPAAIETATQSKMTKGLLSVHSFIQSSYEL